MKHAEKHPPKRKVRGISEPTGDFPATALMAFEDGLGSLTDWVAEEMAKIVPPARFASLESSGELESITMCVGNVMQKVHSDPANAKRYPASWDDFETRMLQSQSDFLTFIKKHLGFEPEAGDHTLEVLNAVYSAVASRM